MKTATRGIRVGHRSSFEQSSGDFPPDVEADDTCEPAHEIRGHEPDLFPQHPSDPAEQRRNHECKQVFQEVPFTSFDAAGPSPVAAEGLWSRFDPTDDLLRLPILNGRKNLFRCAAGVGSSGGGHPSGVSPASWRKEGVFPDLPEEKPKLRCRQLHAEQHVGIAGVVRTIGEGQRLPDIERLGGNAIGNPGFPG